MRNDISPRQPQIIDSAALAKELRDDTYREAMGQVDADALGRRRADAASHLIGLLVLVAAVVWILVALFR